MTVAGLRPPDLFLLSLLLGCCGVEVGADTEFRDTTVIGRRTLSLADSPYLVSSDVLVEREGELVVEAGVRINFRPGVGITVRGVLTAQGEPDNKIVFTSAGETGGQHNRTVRLVDGPTVQQGVIQVGITIPITTQFYS